MPIHFHMHIRSDLVFYSLFMFHLFFVPYLVFVFEPRLGSLSKETIRTRYTTSSSQVQEMTRPMARRGSKH